MPHPKDRKTSVGFCLKRIHLKKSNILEARQTLKILGVVISSHIISFRLLPISGHLRATQENQNWLIRNRKISCNRGKIFLIFSKFFTTDRKNPYFVLITGELVSLTTLIFLWEPVKLNPRLAVLWFLWFLGCIVLNLFLFFPTFLGGNWNLTV